MHIAMTDEEYKIKIDQIRANALKEVSKLERAYVKSVAEYKVGDEISNGFVTIVVQGIGINHQSSMGVISIGLPDYYYYGVIIASEKFPDMIGQKTNIYPYKILK